MKSQESIFNLLSEIFKRYNITPVLVGGIALNANKVQRMTFDIDFIITEENFNKLEKDIIDIGYSIFHRQEAFIQLKSNNDFFRDIDFLLSDDKTINILISEGKKHLIDNNYFYIPSPMHLVEMKLHSISFNRIRIKKDLPDIIQLLLLNKINPNSRKVKQLLKKYNLSELHVDIKNSVGDTKLDE